MKAPGFCYKIDFGPGPSPAPDGYFVGGYGYTRNSMNPLPLYGYEPLFDSADAVESRHTRRVPCTSRETSYSGTWADEADERYYEKGEASHEEKRAKVSETTGSSLELTFRGAAIYSHTLKAEYCGKAAVYLDGRLEETADCYAEEATPYQFAFVRTGLDPSVTHTIKVAVLGQKNPRFQRDGHPAYPVRVCGRELSASDGFSAFQGRTSGSTYERNETDSPMTFKDPKWAGGGQCEIGYYHMLPDAGQAVRKWVAPCRNRSRRGPRVGRASARGRVNASILKNAAVVWPIRAVTSGKPASHDTTVPWPHAMPFISSSARTRARPPTGLHGTRSSPTCRREGFERTIPRVIGSTRPLGQVFSSRFALRDSSGCREPFRGSVGQRPDAPRYTHAARHQIAPSRRLVRG